MIRKSTLAVCPPNWTAALTWSLRTPGSLLATLPITVLSLTSLNLRSSYWAAELSFVGMVFLSCLAFLPVVPIVSEVRNLGGVMSSNLSWRSYVLSISRRVHFSLHWLKYHRNILLRELRSTLVTSLIFPILYYCCLVYNDLTDELNTKPQQLINYGIRLIIDLRRDVHISPFRRSLGWLTSCRLYFPHVKTKYTEIQ